MYEIKHYTDLKKALERADQIICISKNTLEDLNYYYNINNKKIDVIYLGTNAFNSFNTQFQKKENLKKNIYFCWKENWL